MGGTVPSIFFFKEQPMPALTATAASASSTDAAVDMENIVESIAEGTRIPGFVVSIILSVLIFAAAKVISYLIRRFFKRLSERNPKFSVLMASLLWRICSVLVWMIAILSILAVWGIDLTPLIAGLGVTGVVLGFALQESIGSLFSGFMIAVNNPFRVGDWVEIGQDGVAGTVIAMDLMCVTLATGDNKKYTVNNKYVWSNTILNYSYIERRRIDMSIDIGYSMDTEKARKVLFDLVSSYPEVLSDPAPVVEVNKYGASGITLIVRPWVKPSDYWNIYWRFNGEVLAALRANGLDMPFNQLDVHIIKEE